MSLEVRGLSFGYEEGRRIFEDFTAEFGSRRITALTGRNGAGKTTLAKLITGVLKPERGCIYVDGEDIGDRTIAQRSAMIGYVMQNPSMQIFSETVEKEMEYGLRNSGMEEEEIFRRREEYLKYFELEEYRWTFPFNLSCGEKRRLVLAAVMAVRPGYLILDEPSSGLDARRKRMLGELLRRTVKKCGVVLISHDRDFIGRYCDGEIRIGPEYEGY